MRAAPEPVAAAPTRQAPMRLCVLRIGDQHFALPVAFVRETVHLGDVAPIPSVHPAIAGLAHLRSQPLVVVDLLRLLGLQTTIHADADADDDGEGVPVLVCELPGALDIALLVSATVRVCDHDPARCRQLATDVGNGAVTGVVDDPQHSTSALLLDPHVLRSHLMAIRPGRTP